MTPQALLAAAQAAALLINVVGATVQAVKDMLSQTGASDEELNAILTSVDDDRKVRLAFRESVVPAAQADGHPGD